MTYETADGETLDSLCLDAGAYYELGGSDGQSVRWEFDDNSAIVDCGGNGWDLEGTTKWRWAGVE